MSKGSVVQASFVFHQKAREMGCYELCQQRSAWRGRCERVWRSGYKIGRGKFIPWSKFHFPDQDEVPILECSVASENIKANFVLIKPRRAEFSKTPQKHQESTDEGNDDLSEESRNSTTKIFFSAPKRVALSLINAIRHYRSISNVGDTNMFLNMKLFMTAP